MPDSLRQQEPSPALRRCRNCCGSSTEQCRCSLTRDTREIRSIAPLTCMSECKDVQEQQEHRAQLLGRRVEAPKTRHEKGIARYQARKGSALNHTQEQINSSKTGRASDWLLWTRSPTSLALTRQLWCQVDLCLKAPLRIGVYTDVKSRSSLFMESACCELEPTVMRLGRCQDDLVAAYRYRYFRDYITGTDAYLCWTGQ